MRNVAVCGSNVKNALPQNHSLETIEIHQTPVTFGIIPTPDPDFKRRSLEHSCSVLVRVLAFSCNYRDLFLIFAPFKTGGANSFRVLGSEFVGEVIEVGAQVYDFQPGDRVIGNNCYSAASSDDKVARGIPTNEASSEYQIFHRAKLIKIPREMPTGVAAAFSVGAQTAYSLIRRVNISAGCKVLVTAAKSNTSLFVINALRKHRPAIYAASTSLRFAPELKARGVREVIQIEPASHAAPPPELARIASAIGGFDCVIDPFFDLYFGRTIELMAFGGRYITCGLAEQYHPLIGQEFQRAEAGFKQIFVRMISQNLQIMGNCLGLMEDLNTALQDYSSGSFAVVMDSVFSGNQVGAFFARTFAASERFGKVVYQYD